jgi:hypothetical protein
VRVTHPFHPWAGQELEFVKRRRNWQADRVYARAGSGELVSLPAEWTDAVPDDAFVVVARGRAPFHVDGLVVLSELVASLAAAGGSRRGAGRRGRVARRQANYAVSVRRIMPRGR